MNLTDLSVDQLKKAASIKEQIAKLEQELESVLGGKAGFKAKSGGMSAAARAKISAAAKARWAKVKSNQKPAKPSGKRTMSPAAKAKIAAAARARWAKIKAAKGK